MVKSYDYFERKRWEKEQKRIAEFYLEHALAEVRRKAYVLMSKKLNGKLSEFDLGYLTALQSVWKDLGLSNEKNYLGWMETKPGEIPTEPWDLGI